MALLALAALAPLLAAWPLQANGPAADAPAVFLAPGGSDAAACTRAEPCRSFERAYRLARPGAVVEVAAGTYGAQTIVADPGRRGPRVVFRPAPGAKVVLDGELIVRGAHLEFRDLRLAGGWSAHPGAADLVFRRVTTAHLFVISASDVSVLGGSVGPGVNYDSQITSAEPGAMPPTRVLIDGVRFHDWTRTGDEHVECLQVGAAVGLIIRNSRFLRCETHDVFIRSWGSDYPIRDVLIENNFFGETRVGYSSLRIAPQDGVLCERVLVRHNSALQPMLSDCEGRGVRFRSNLLSSMEPGICNAGGSSWDWNVYGRGRRCGPHDHVAPPRFRAPERLDLHLLPSAAAIDRGDPTSFPRRDIDGDRRPAGSRPDAGADEARARPGRKARLRARERVQP